MLESAGLFILDHADHTWVFMFLFQKTLELNLSTVLKNSMSSSRIFSNKLLPIMLKILYIFQQPGTHITHSSVIYVY